MPSDIERDNLIDELEALARREVDGGALTRREVNGPGGHELLTFVYKIRVIAVKMCKWWYEWVNKYGLDREVVNIAFSVFYLHLYHTKDGDKLTEEEDKSISVASLLIAIKGKYPRMYEVVDDESLAYTLVRDLGGNAADVPALYQMEREMLASTLAGRLHHITTMHQFANLVCKLHPVIDEQPSLLDYFLSATRFQFENALLDEQVMAVFNPSVIALAAMSRIVDNVEEEESERLMEELAPVIGSSEREVLEAMFQLQIKFPHIPRSQEFDAAMAASIAARRYAEANRPIAAFYHRPESPRCVGGI